jgi:hypothetical protein
MAITMTEEAVSLRDCEARIEASLQSYIEVGKALDDIRASKSYRDVAPTFEQYCLLRWAWNPSHVWHFIHASRVAEILSTFVEKPRTETYARPLTPLLGDPDGLREVWRGILARCSRPLTKRMIAEAVDEYRNPPPVASVPDREGATDMPPLSFDTTEATPSTYSDGVARQLLPPLIDPSHLLPGQQEKERYSRPVKSLRARLFDIVKDYPGSAVAIEVAQQVEREEFDLSADDCRRLSEALADTEHGRRALKRALESKRPRRKRKGHQNGSTA